MALWIPPSAVKSPAYQCGVCGHPFYENERFQWMHHVPKCADENWEEIRKLVPSGKGFFFEEVDPEWGDYNRALKAKGIDPEAQYERRSKRSPKRTLRES